MKTALNIGGTSARTEREMPVVGCEYAFSRLRAPTCLDLPCPAGRYRRLGRGASPPAPGADMPGTPETHGALSQFGFFLVKGLRQYAMQLRSLLMEPCDKEASAGLSDKCAGLHVGGYGWEYVRGRGGSNKAA